jgi:lipooligosaccharide transport system ATP-binding protein
MSEFDQPLISATNLTKTFGEFTAVDGINFQVAKGEAFGLLGPNGAGKSTTMRMISATMLRSSGDLTILSKDPNTHGPEIRAHLGVVPQQDTLDRELKVGRTYTFMAATLAWPASL